MHPFERAALRIRHAPGMRRAAPLWNLLRPAYDRVVAVLGSRGLHRNINGTDPIVVAPELRNLGETYEPGVWGRIMQEVRAADVIADVGAHVGLYSVAFAKRVGATGHVHAFEPDPSNCGALRRHVELNAVSATTHVHQMAVGKEDAQVAFASRAEQSHLSSDANSGSFVRCVTLDRFLPGQRIDVLKIDVEGYEEWVLKGARNLLDDAARKPRAIFVEVHPYAWTAAGTSSESLLATLRAAGYRARSMGGEDITAIRDYGHLCATPE